MNGHAASRSQSTPTPKIRIPRFPALTLRARLSLWTTALLVVCTALLALFINLTTAWTQHAGYFAMSCEPVPARVPITDNLRSKTVVQFSQRCVDHGKPPALVANLVASPDVLHHLHTTSIVGLMTVLLLGMAGTYWLTGRALCPLRQLSEASAAITVDTLDTRLNVQGAEDELKRFADAFDAMLARLQDGIAHERRFISDASHELRTPLAIMRTNLEVTRSDPNMTPHGYQSAIDTVERSLNRLERLVGDLLLLAQDGGEVLGEEVALAPLMGDTLEELRDLAGQHHVTLTSALDATPSLHGNEMLLRRAFSNLVENGIRYNRPGGQVRVSLVETPAESVVTVEDTGVGIPPEEQEHIFERFYRVDRSRARAHGGAGLGLTLASQIISLHGGSIEAQSTPGAGSTFTVRLPTPWANEGNDPSDSPHLST